MSAGLFSAATRAGVARNAMTRVARRNFSAESHQAHHEATMKQWEKVTKMAIPLIGVLAAANFFLHMSHGHHEAPEKKYTYQSIVHKKFPWSECPQCGFFETECWAKCRAEK
ncbi:Cytochrome c oxidase subunit 6A, mitochondrial [Hondaea fermentalgiana]|uniref:Cytochrome c oxidase subunit 6A, mitochondrial n=1 Tax=Hondaea fermentalgiana TaxID=2315210 RepID=A0A2R5G8I9_9STRA|nr:Cytochrome c oxidase subunit 6A, mitochondrial [Hondaea fermentalgiana]|eukprot:GBG24361.1 Cytochrome c oxidase subunit 6A, mitochondrial [Hondaea fermentalgiana]